MLYSNQLEQYASSVLTYCVAVCLYHLSNRNPSPNSVLRPFELNIGTPVTPTPQSVYANFGFLRFLVLDIGARSLRGCMRDGRTDRRTDTTHIATY